MADTKTIQDLDKLEIDRRYYRDFREGRDAHNDAINAVPFDAVEAMAMAKTFDEVSKDTRNGLTDSMTATIYLERAARVMAQLPDGEVQAMGRKDRGKAAFMDILRTKWIYPNANAQRSLKTKLFLWKYKTSVYNWMPMYFDLNLSPSGYFGPDCWLWNPRNFIPQPGMVSLSDMDHVHALAYKPPQYFRDLLDDDSDTTWDKDALREVIDVLKNSKKGTDGNETQEQKDKQPSEARLICVATRYEAGKDGKWITFLPDHNFKVLRDIKNPHKNGRIPFVILQGIPDETSFYGTGDFQRSMPMQAANDGVLNFYFEGIRRNLYPQTWVNAQTFVAHTWSDEPGAVVEFNGPPDAKTADTSTAGLSTFQAAQGVIKGAIQSAAGTTDTRQNAEQSADPGFAKTPEGLKQIAAREDTRDAQDRAIFEEACQELFDGMLSLIPTITEKIPVDLFAEEAAEIVKGGAEDLLDLFKDGQNLVDEQGNTLFDEQGEPQKYQSKIVKSGLATKTESQTGSQVRLRIDPTKLKGLEYRFELAPDSTAKKTKEGQLQALMDWFGFIGKMPNALQQMQESSGKVLDWDKINEIYASLSDIPGIDEVFKDAPPPQPEQEGQPGQGAATDNNIKQIVNYKDAPEDIKRQMEIAEGYVPSKQSMMGAAVGQSAGEKQAADTQNPDHPTGGMEPPQQPPAEAPPTPDMGQAPPQGGITDPDIAAKAQHLASLAGQ